MTADDWLLAEGGQGRSYIVHTRAPRFIARVVELHDGKPAEPIDTVGFSYQLEHAIICEFDWIDPEAEEIVRERLASAALVEFGYGA